MKVLASVLMLTAFILTENAPVVAKLSSMDSVAAKITEAKGLVKTRDYIDWNKQLWSEPSDAKVGDVLNEGMQIGTGDDSWAQVTWPHVVARAWSNSSYAIAPNHKLVYLTSGELLFQLDKHRKDKSDYCIWTNLLQARIRGTTVLVQSTNEYSRISVLEGTIDVLNRVEHSVVRLRPGVVYEIRPLEKAGLKPISMTTSQENHKLTAFNNSNHSAKSIEEVAFGVKSASLPEINADGLKTIEQDAVALASPSESPEPKNVLFGSSPAAYLSKIINERSIPVFIFETAKSLTSAYAIDPDAVIKSGLLSRFQSELPSAALVEKSLANLGDPDATFSTLLKGGVTALRAPTDSNYRIGQVFSNVLELPAQSAANWSPAGWIETPTLDSGIFAHQTAFQIVTQNSSQYPILSLLKGGYQWPTSPDVLGPSLPGGSSLPGAIPSSLGLVTNNALLVGSNGLVSAALARSLSTVGVTGLTGVGVSGSQLNALTLNALGLNALGLSRLGLTGSVNNLLTSLGLSNTLNGLIGNGGLVNGLLGNGALVNNLNNTVGGTTNTLQHTTTNTTALLNSTLNGLLGGIGHHH